MKRLISVFLVWGIVLTTMPVSVTADNKEAFVFSDIENTDYYAEAAKDLMELGILTGYNDGTFKGENTITRAEMAVIVCKMLKKTQAETDAAKNNNSFADVDADYWARWYINLASQEGIINGDGYGFRPNDKVLYEEAIKMIVCTLGYGDNVKIDEKDWSKGYLDIAEDKGISKGLTGEKGTAATRGDVALMANNALDSKDSDGDGYNDFEDLKPDEKYRVPIILLHGWNSDTESAFGIKTNLSGLNNTYFEPDGNPEQENKYGDPSEHQIIQIQSGKLGDYLENNMSYVANGNLFAFNYPNQDVVQFNGGRLKNYVANLIESAQSSGTYVYGDYLFPTESAKKNGEVEFVLIGHSMGGLVSRYYVENLNADCVAKLITIDTPHYGSGYAELSAAFNIMYSPAVAEMKPDSTLYGVSKGQPVVNKLNKKVSDYVAVNQSPALKGNKNVSAKYYAIAGYNADASGEVNLSESLEDSIFSFELLLDTSSKTAFKNSINNSLNKYSEGSVLYLGDASGDNTVDYMSQLAVNFDGDTVYCQSFEGAYMIVNTKHINVNFHSYINSTPEMHKCIESFIES